MKTNLPESIFNFLLDSSLITDQVKVHSVSGGDISQAYKVQSGTQSLFLKLNASSRFKMFEAEANGLHVLKNESSFLIPKVLTYDQVGDWSLIVMDYIDIRLPADQASLGRQLAQMHQSTQDFFGLDEPNFIAMLPQNNEYKNSWQEFFSINRLEAQFKMAFDQGYFDSKNRKDLEFVMTKLNEIVPIEPPALVHGDLWAGNYLNASDGQHVLIDPAVYYGHREMDLAMMHLFGGFQSSVFTEYHDTYPLEHGWQSRLDLHNLYPLLVHVNLFGASYVQQVKSNIHQYL